MTGPKVFVKDERLRPVWRVLVYVLVVLAGLTVASLAFYSAVLSFGLRPAGISLEIIFVVLQAVVTVGAAFALRHYLDHRSQASLGLALRRPWPRLFAVGLLFGAGMQTIVFVLEVAFGHVRSFGLGRWGTDLELLGGAALVFLCAALAEEMSLRGYILQNLWEEWGFLPAAIVSSTIFAALHLRNPHSHDQLWLAIGGLLIFGLWACLSVLWTKSLWLVLGCHTAWNFFEGPIYGFPVSGVSMPLPTVISTTTGFPTWFTGGGFGPEAGLSSIIAMACGTFVLWRLHVSRALPSIEASA